MAAQVARSLQSWRAQGSRPASVTGWESDSCSLEKGARITPEDKDTVETILLRKPLPVSPLLPFSRLYKRRGCSAASTDSEVTAAGSNPHQQWGPSSTLCWYCPVDGTVSPQKAKVTVIASSLWKCLFLDETRFCSSSDYYPRNCFSLYHLKIIKRHYYLTATT